MDNTVCLKSSIQVLYVKEQQREDLKLSIKPIVITTPKKDDFS